MLSQKQSRQRYLQLHIQLSYEADIQKREVPALKADISFWISSAEGNLALMKKALEEGVCGFVGLQPSPVSVTDEKSTQCPSNLVDHVRNRLCGQRC
jgi:hypothetical protein